MTRLQSTNFLKFGDCNAAQPGETDLYLYGYIMDAPDWFVDENDVIKVKDVREKLLGIETDIINVHINSNGGSAFDGVAIHNLLKQHKARINVYVDGIAASAASLIAMAGDRIIMPENSMMMIHRASTYAYGNAADLEKTAADLKKIDSAVLANYKNRFVETEEELTALISAETFLTAAECYQFGFCDEILTDKQIGEPKNAAALKTALLSKYQK